MQHSRRGREIGDNNSNKDENLFRLILQLLPTEILDVAAHQRNVVLTLVEAVTARENGVEVLNKGNAQ
jgi:hypothetical protein